MHALELRSLREDTNRRLEAQQVEILALRREVDEQRPRMLAAWAALEALVRWQAETAVFGRQRINVIHEGSSSVGHALDGGETLRRAVLQTRACLTLPALRLGGHSVCFKC